MRQKYTEKIETFVSTCQKAAKFGLLNCSSGNMSYRLDGDLVALSASKSWLGEITSEQVSICSLDGKCLNGKKPTIESRFHLGILKNRAEVNVVLHFQSPYATAIACGPAEKYNFFVIPEIPIYIGKIGIVEYLLPGSEELAEKVIEAMTKHNLVIMKNHGQVTVGKNFEEAIQRAVFFELSCKIIMAQNKLCPLSEKNANTLQEQFSNKKTL